MVARAPAALVATSWDALAREHLIDGARGAIHSVFDRALNLRVDDGALVGLVGPGAGNGPATVVLAAPPAISFPSSGLTPDQPWSVSSGRLALGTATVTVDLSAACVWRPARQVQPGDSQVPGAAAPGVAVAEAVSHDQALARIRRAEQIAGAAAPTGGFAPLLPHVASLVHACSHDVEAPELPPDRATRETVCVTGGWGAPSPVSPSPIVHRALTASAELVRGWHSSDPDRVLAAALSLTGLGPGLTPSGDDLLAGFLVGVAWACDDVDPALCAAVVAAMRGRTTDIAAARVRHAAKGLIEERMEDVLAALLTVDGTDVAHAVRRAAVWGHTSGVDTLVGLFLGLRLGFSGPLLPTSSPPGE